MPAVSGKRVVVVGDSLSSGASSPGGVMAEHLRIGGAAVMINAKVGRSAWSFFGREDAGVQLAAIRAWAPHHAIIVLGTNDIGLSMQQDAERMRQLRDGLAASGATVWAFGPPAFQGGRLAEGAPAVFDMMRDVFGDTLIDLRPLTLDAVTVAGGRAADGVHFSAAGGATVGARMAAVFLDAGGSSSVLWIALGLLGLFILAR